VGSQFAALPGAVRKYETQQTPLFRRFLRKEQPMRIFRQFEKAHAFVEV